MAKQRIVNTRFWDDSYIVALKPLEKFLFLYLLTNPLTNISGIYELPMRRIVFDTGMSEEEIGKTLEKFSKIGKIIYRDGWVAIKNFIKHQTLNPKVRRGILLELEKAPKELVDSLCIDYQRLLSEPAIGLDTLSHLNLNSNSNTNLNQNGGIKVSLEPVFDNVKRIGLPDSNSKLEHPVIHSGKLQIS